LTYDETPASTSFDPIHLDEYNHYCLLAQAELEHSRSRISTVLPRTLLEGK
jgi:hypothetical protein